MHKVPVLGILVASFLFTNVAYAAPLTAPSNLGVTPLSSSELDLAWVDNSSQEAGFEVERSADGTNYSYYDEVGSNVEAYSDTGLTEDTTYHYRVRAYKNKKNGRQYGGYSNAASGTTFVSVPAAPSNLVATLFTASSTPWIEMSWTDNSDNETYFDIERSTDGVNFSVYGTNSSNNINFYDWNVTASTTYYYRVNARNSGGSSTYSNVDSVFIF